GTSAANEVRVEDQLPLEWRFVSVETSQGSGTNDQGIVRCELGALAAGANALVRVSALPLTVGLVTNTVTASARETDLGPANNTASVAVAVQKAADLAVRQSALPDPVLLGGRLTYELEVSNGGPSEATGVRVEDTLPAGVTVVSVETSQGSTANDQGILRGELGDLAAGSNATVRIVVEATALGSLTNVA